MAIIIPVHFEESDSFDAVVDEIDLIVPKYLEALHDLQAYGEFSKIPLLMQNVRTYWDRLVSLLKYAEAYEDEINIRKIIVDTFQNELRILEEIYLRIDRSKIVSQPLVQNVTSDVALSVLRRMDVLLTELGFVTNHKDRVLIRELIDDNRAVS